MKLGRDALLALKARRAGARYAWRIIQEARRAGVPISLAFALVEHESGFRNVFGHDPTIYAGAGVVTKAKYLAYKRQRGLHGEGGMQGVGPCQLTYWSTQDRADAQGGCWRPGVNIAVALEELASLIKMHGQHDGVRAYNGAGAAAEEYARTVLAMAGHWHRVLS